MKVMIAGANGNIGSSLTQFFKNNSYEVFQTFRSFEGQKSGGVFTNDALVLIPGTPIPDVIVNCTGFYIPNPTLADIELMTNGITGTVNKILRSNLSWGARIINFSSYFQFSPKPIESQSVYIGLKNMVSEMLERHSCEGRLLVTDLVLYDNYGGKKKIKFFDKLLDSTKNMKPMDASSGKSRINLIHIFDISQAVSILLDNPFPRRNFEKFQLRGTEEFSLLELSRLVTQLTGRVSCVNFGILPDRIFEVTELWDSAPTLPRWKPTRRITDYIYSEFGDL